MTMTFSSFNNFANHLGNIHFGKHALEALDIAAGIIERDAKEEIGKYQRSNMGKYPPWAELADSTKAQRVALGFSENEPLLRTGAMRDSISHYIDGLDAYIGSPSKILVWQEFGTDRIPPRSVLGLSAYRNIKKVLELIGTISMYSLVHGKPSPLIFNLKNFSDNKRL